MKGLLLKDWYMVLKYEKLYLAFLFAYAVLSGLSFRQSVVFISINVLLGSLTVKTVMAYEEQNKWDCLAVNLPVSAAELVWEKYLVGLGGVLFSCAVTFLVLGVMSLFPAYDCELPLMPMFVFEIAVGMLFLAVQLPLLFKYGTVKGRMAQIILIGLVAMIAGVGGTQMAAPETDVTGPMTWPTVAAVFLAAALGLFLSGRLSVSFYEKREF